MDARKTLLFIIPIAAALILSACGSHKNPLLTAKPKDAAAFLVKASKIANNKLTVYVDYGRCVGNRNTFINPLTKKDMYRKTCDPLYTAMAAFGKTTTQFKNITVSDISDKKMYKKLQTNLLNAGLAG